jgi:hypothetical protein
MKLSTVIGSGFPCRRKGWDESKSFIIVKRGEFIWVEEYGPAIELTPEDIMANDWYLQSDQSQLNIEQNLATVIHHKTCHCNNHIDSCGWECGNWQSYGEHSARAVYLEKAQKILAITKDVKLIKRIIGEL